MGTVKLYRTCLCSVRILRKGNENDEFVNRENELNSRANYYHDYTKENFVQESDCFWTNQTFIGEDNIQRYLTYIRKGEENRKWILSKYKFHDPYLNSFDEQRLKVWETKAFQLLKDILKLD